jgi:hypothetical protein
MCKTILAGSFKFAEVFEEKVGFFPVPHAMILAPWP